MIYALIVFLLVTLFISILNSILLKETVNRSAETEIRALAHFSKLYKITRIVNEAEAEKEPSVITIDKIKEVIRSTTTNNF